MKLVLLITGTLAVLQSTAQSTTQLVSADGRMIGDVGNINGAVITTIHPKDIEGKPNLGSDWNYGTVYFKKGKRADSLLLHFDIAENKIYFKQNDVPLSFLEEVAAFWLYPSEEIKKKDLLFRSGYPATGQHNMNSFYEVMADEGPLHLLKYRSMIITESYVYNAPARRKYIPHDDLYLFIPQSSIIQKIKMNKKSLEKQLPEYAGTIESLCEKNKWELKTEAEVVELVKELNSRFAK
ncbi:MAG TPA: hypothetical protein PKC72_15870 [Chitinophagaceae bacterium]|nr:hypothetical protein [Chitinophagaceae bacterium]